MASIFSMCGRLHRPPGLPRGTLPNQYSATPHKLQQKRAEEYRLEFTRCASGSRLIDLQEELAFG
jgi:hypothetical protein